MRRKVIIITQNGTLLREAMEAKIYRKICTACGVGVRARARNKRNCPSCGGTLRAATADERATDMYRGDYDMNCRKGRSWGTGDVIVHAASGREYRLENVAPIELFLPGDSSYSYGEADPLHKDYGGRIARSELARRLDRFITFRSIKDMMAAGYQKREYLIQAPVREDLGAFI